jgi:3D-(3,5/4)-trihydroxycyclohexane-1,2-dione acylhydrolase (decyclizing)
VQPLDASKCADASLVADARVGLALLTQDVRGWQADAGWTRAARDKAADWVARVTALTQCPALPAGELPYDADVIGAVRDSAADSAHDDVVVCAAGTLPAELHKLWRAGAPGNYHVEYGYSCMGYEIAGGLGVKMARPQQEVIVMIGDGSYLMMNSEIATSVMLGLKLIIVVLDNRGYGCIQRLQLASGGARFNNMLDDCIGTQGRTQPVIDFRTTCAQPGRTMPCMPPTPPQLRSRDGGSACRTHAPRCLSSTRPTNAPRHDGGCWWEVAIPEVSGRAEVERGTCRVRHCLRN